MSDKTLFVRKASGLVRAWSVFDAFIYATFSINLITLGLFIFSYCYYFEGNIATAIVIGAVFTVFEVILYSSLISAMPRSGGDYVWQSRILGRGWGFILAVTGWWFILWLWVPLYGQMLVYEFFTPILAILGAQNAALWFTGTNAGMLVGMISVNVIVFVYIAIGMKWYARVQKFCFFGGAIGLLLVFILLIVGNKPTFINNLNAIVPSMFGAEAMDLYKQTLEAGQAAGTVTAPLGNLALGASVALIPLAELGFHALRRSQRCERFQTKPARHDNGHHRNNRSCACFLCPYCKEHRMGFLQQSKRRLLELYMGVC